MTVAEMTAREMRNTAAPTVDMMVECCELLRNTGWEWMISSYTPEGVCPYNYGWWINANHPTKNRPTGNADYMLAKAWNTVKAYVKQD